MCGEYSGAPDNRTRVKVWLASPVDRSSGTPGQSADTFEIRTVVVMTALNVCHQEVSRPHAKTSGGPEDWRATAVRVASLFRSSGGITPHEFALDTRTGISGIRLSTKRRDKVATLPTRWITTRSRHHDGPSHLRRAVRTPIRTRFDTSQEESTSPPPGSSGAPEHSPTALPDFVVESSGPPDNRNRRPLLMASQVVRSTGIPDGSTAPARLFYPPEVRDSGILRPHA